MTLAVGTQLGSFEITGQIGAGGMGEVYRASDSKLGREVAIKTLPAALAADEDRLARFEREAKLLAALNHPHIASVYSLDEHDGTLYIAMELVDGETLEEKLKAGALSADEALHLALQITEALEAAHDKGVIHRDLKPANVMVTKDGIVKVLDFGLAKAFSDDPSQSRPDHSPALSLAMTQAGLVLGTAGYMSPEQASGQPTDQRADIWAFGVVLYEMLTGLPLFGGESVPHILADVLKTEPDWNRLPQNLHPRLKLMLERCLTKRPRDRYHSIADARVDIQNVLAHPDVAVGETIARQPGWQRWLPYAASVTLAVALGAVLIRPEPLPDVIRFTVEAGPGETLPPGVPAISPDGRTLAYVTEDESGASLRLRSLDSLETRTLPGTDGAMYAFWSPDGRSLAFVAQPGSDLKRIDIAGGSPRGVVDGVRGPWHGSWGPGGDILLLADEGLVRKSAEAGVATSSDLIDSDLAYPYFLPDGVRFLAYSYDAATIELGSLDGSDRSVILDNVQSAPLLAPTPGGKTYLLFMRAPDLMVQEFDASSGTLLGNAAVLVSDIGQVASPAFRPSVSVSPAGVLSFQTGAAVSTDLWQWVDRSGQPVEPLPDEVSISVPRISNDESALAGERTDNSIDSIYTIELARPSPVKRTFRDELSQSPVWSPDDTELAFVVFGLEPGLFILDLETGDESRIGDTPLRPTSWSPDGRHLLAHDAEGVWLVSADGADAPIPIGSRNGRSRNAVFSPDGKHIAFSSDESGELQIYVVPTPPATGPQQPVSINGGSHPRWSTDSNELFFLYLGTGIMAVEVDTSDGFAAGIPELLFTAASFLPPTGYDVSRDGQRFLVPLVSEDNDSDGTITVVVNWWAELER
jgi:Tol biopolymer transport system component